MSTITALVPPLDIDHIDRPLAPLYPRHILQQYIRRDVKLAFRVARQVRRDDAFRVRPERVARREWFGVGHVDEGAKEAGRVERFDKFFWARSVGRA